ncbi:MAG: NRDE family protein [Sphingomonadaceae bacterium]|nr:NRDE family protein [Sphingomonadaceae bacterium]
MCVAALAWAAHPRWRLVVAANRDEFHDRPTAPLARWDNGVIAGRDLEAGGTWLGINGEGRFALVTNFRLPGYPKPGFASRGGLVVDWLLARPDPDGATMNPFHQLRVGPDGASHVTNRPAPSSGALAAGLHGVSNGRFDQPWPKTQRLTAALGQWLSADTANPEGLFGALADENPLPAEADSEGPDVPFSPVFIRNPAYGTRCSTVVLVDAGGHGTIIERRFDPAGLATGETALEFNWT